jgi:hypothetical protein
LEFSFGEVFVASWADPSSGIGAAKGWLITVWAEFFVHFRTTPFKLLYINI